MKLLNALYCANSLVSPSVRTAWIEIRASGSMWATWTVAVRKGGAECYAMTGDNRFHSMFPAPADGAKSAFIKFAFRKSIDFPVVNCAVSVGTDSPRICLNAVAPTPYRARGAEEFIAGKPIDEATADAAGVAAVRDSAPFDATRYKIQLAKTMVKRVLLKAVD